MTQPHVVGNDFLTYLDRQVTSDAVRFEMILFADNVIATTDAG